MMTLDPIVSEPEPELSVVPLGHTDSYVVAPVREPGVCCILTRDDFRYLGAWLDADADAPERITILCRQVPGDRITIYRHASPGAPLVATICVGGHVEQVSLSRGGLRRLIRDGGA